MNKKIALATISFLVITGCYLVLSSISNDVSAPVSTPVLTTNENVQVESGDIIEDTEVTETKEYSNEEVGISFKYPDIFDREQMKVLDGTTGRKFSGVLEFSPNHWISFGGITNDYSSPRGGSITDNQGYIKEGDNYFIFGVRPVDYELWSYNEGNDKALVVKNTEIEQILDRESIAVFVNIPNSDFAGIVFTLSPKERGKEISDSEIKILRDIVSSIKLNKLSYN